LQFRCVRLYWTANKVVVVVDVDDYGEIGESRLGEAADAIEASLEPEVEDVPIPPIPLPTSLTNGDQASEKLADEPSDEDEPRPEAA
jgi:hypothetical protein